MNPKTIDAIRDLALKYENQDLQVAFELMQIAHSERPKGLYIKNKFLQYRERLDAKSKEQLELIALVKKVRLLLYQ